MYGFLHEPFIREELKEPESVYDQPADECLYDQMEAREFGDYAGVPPRAKISNERSDRTHRKIAQVVCGLCGAGCEVIHERWRIANEAGLPGTPSLQTCPKRNGERID